MHSGKKERHNIYKPIYKGRIIALALMLMITLVLTAACGENPKNTAAADGGFAAEDKAAYEKGETDVRTEHEGQQLACITYTKTNGMIYNEDFTAVITPNAISYARFFREDGGYGADGDYAELSEAAIESEQWERLEEAVWTALPKLEEKKTEKSEKSEGILSIFSKKLGNSHTDGGDESSFRLLWKLPDGSEEKAEYSTADESELLSVIQIMTELVQTAVTDAEDSTAE